MNINSLVIQNINILNYNDKLYIMILRKLMKIFTGSYKIMYYHFYITLT